MMIITGIRIILFLLYFQIYLFGDIFIELFFNTDSCAKCFLVHEWGQGNPVGENTHCCLANGKKNKNNGVQYMIEKQKLLYILRNVKIKRSKYGTTNATSGTKHNALRNDKIIFLLMITGILITEKL